MFEFTQALLTQLFLLVFWGSLCGLLIEFAYFMAATPSGQPEEITVDTVRRFSLPPNI